MRGTDILVEQQSPQGVFVCVHGLIIDGEVSRGEKMALRGTDPESYITDTLVSEDELSFRQEDERHSDGLAHLMGGAHLSRESGGWIGERRVFSSNGCVGSGSQRSRKGCEWIGRGEFSRACVEAVERGSTSHEK